MCPAFEERESHPCDNMQVFLGARASVLRDRNARSSASHTIENTGVGDVEGPRHAEHFVVEAEEPSTGEPYATKRDQ